MQFIENTEAATSFLTIWSEITVVAYYNFKNLDFEVF